MTRSHFTDALHLGILVLTACSTPDATAPARESVKAAVVVAQQTALPAYHSVAGTVRSQTSSTLSANMVGTVLRVNVSEGDRVRQGDVLVEIESSVPRAQAEQARSGSAGVESAIQAAAANAQLAQTTYERFAALRERGSASVQEFDEAKTRHKTAQAELSRLVALRSEVRAAATQADAVVAYGKIRSPITGVVTARLVDPGAQAAPGVPLVTVEEERASRVDVNVPENITVRVGDAALVQVGEQNVPARVTHVQPSLDAGGRSALVKLRLEQPLRAGSYVKVSIAQGQREVLAIPAGAVVRRGQLTSVFVVGPDDVAHMRLVTTGATDASRIEILSGLAAGEAIVATPGQIRDGMIVRRTS
jgi:RND family efflux transporter MFP subunit